MYLYVWFVCVLVLPVHVLSSVLRSSVKSIPYRPTAGARGDLEIAKTNNNISLACSVGSIVNTVVGIGVLGISNSNSRN